MSQAPKLEVAVVEDAAAFREGLETILAQSDRLRCVAVCSSAEEALLRLPGLRPRVVLMDVELPGLSGVECVARLKAQLPETEFMMLTVFEDYDRIYQALLAGATGYLLKRTPAAELLDAILELHEGGSPMSGAIARKVVQAFRQLGVAAAPAGSLSAREQEILSALARGRLYKEIADELGISFHTVRAHLQKIYKKLQVCSREEAVKKFGSNRK